MAKQLALVFDQRRCIGCHTCVIACRVEHSLDGNQALMDVPTDTGADTDLPVGKFPHLKLNWQPTTCMHCQKPSCVEACPDKAISKRADGIVLIDKEKCSGCQLCSDACPYGVIKFDEQSNTAEKCNLCAQRVDKGLQPNCVRECIWGAIHYGDINDPMSDVSKLIKSRKGYVLKPEKGTKPSNHYLSP